MLMHYAKKWAKGSSLNESTVTACPCGRKLDCGVCYGFGSQLPNLTYTENGKTYAFSVISLRHDPEKGPVATGYVWIPNQPRTHHRVRTVQVANLTE